jgi:subtilisin family serine protease
LTTLPFVRYAEPDQAIHAALTPNDPKFTDNTLYGLNGAHGINAPSAWDATTGSTAVTIAEIDTGIDYDHPDLYENIWINQAEVPPSRKANLIDVDGDGLITFYDLNDPRNQGPGKLTDVNSDGVIDAADILAPMQKDAAGHDTGLGGWADGISEDGDTAHVDDLVGWNFVTNTNNPFDDNGHGTHVAGIMDELGNNGTGGVGVAWKAQLLPLKFLDASGGGSAANAVLAIHYAADHGARVSNNSWGSASGSSTISDAINYAGSRGDVFVAAAGNNNSNNDTTPFYPAAYHLPNMLVVAATDSNGARASFSNYGPTTVDLAAPGVGIYSTLPNSYGVLSGTSTAAPYVTGTAALVLSQHPTWTAAQVIQQILSTTTPDAALSGLTVTGGIVNAAAAVDHDLWNGYARDPQHTAVSTVAAQPLDGIHWQTPVDLNPQYSGNDLFIHYGSPVITQANTVLVPVKTGASGGFEVEGINGSTGSVKWTQTTDYILPPHDWVPSYSPTLAPGNRLYFAGAGGTVFYLNNPDAVGASTNGQLAFFGLANYNANPTAYNNNVFINTPITADRAGNIYFGFMVTGTTPLGLQSGLARIAADGSGTWIAAATAAGDSTMAKVVHNCAPALSNDGQHLYVAISNGTGSSFGVGYLVELQRANLQPVARVRLKDVKISSNDAGLPDQGSASPMVGPDGDVYFGVLENNDQYASKGWMLHFSGDLSQIKTPGAFGWDDTASVVDRSLVPSYTGTSPYLLMTKYNNYADFGLDGVNKLAILDPNATQVDARTGTTVMKEVLTIAGPTPDTYFRNQGYPNAVREWCINTAAVDPFTKCVLANSEDGKLYRWDLTTNTFTQVVTLTAGVGEAYTPTVIGPDGTVYAINNATLFAVGLIHFAVSTPSRAMAGNSFLFTVTAQDPFGNTIARYTGTVHLSSTDGQAGLPGDYTFTTGPGGDNGVHSFNATLKTAGNQTLTAIDTATNPIAGTSVPIAVSPAAATHFAVGSPPTATAGTAFGFTVTALDAYNNSATAYSGTVHFTSTDAAGILPGDSSLSNGSGAFSATLRTAGSQTLTATDTARSSISGTSASIAVGAAAATHLAVTAPSSATAGSAFSFMVTALDPFNNTAIGYSGVVHFSSSDSQAVLPADSTLTNGSGTFSATLKTAGSQTLTATDTVNSSIAGTSNAVSVSAGAVSKFLIGVPSLAITGTAFSFTVTSTDAFSNPVVSYGGTVHFSSSDSGAGLPADSTLTNGSGTFSATLNKSGNQTLTATDTANSSITGTSADVAVRGLIVTAFTPTATGFSAHFSKPFVNSGSNPLHLYDAASAGYGPPDVTLVGPSGTVRGSLLIDPSNTSFTFVKTGGPVGGGTTGLLAAGTYTVTFVSGATAFRDATGALLDGNNSGSNGTNYVTTFTATAPTGVTVTIPDFARGPDSTDFINVPNNSPNGIPVALSNGAGVTDATFVLQYNANLLSITGGTANPALTGATFTVTTSGSGAGAQATIVFHSPTALATGAVRLGGLTATVPSNAAYKAKQQLHFSSLALNGGALSAVGDDGIQVVAFLGDTSGDGTFTSADSVLLARVASAADSGFAAFPVLDPVLVGDISGDGRVTATDGGLLNNYLSGNPVVQLPPYPGPPSNNPSGPDPALSIPTDLRVGPDGTVIVPVNLDDPRPAGSTGLTQAVLALTYDPAVFSVSATDIHLGTVPLAGAGWTLQSRVDAWTGQIGILLVSAMPIRSATGGSLVTITFHVRPGARGGTTPINLAAQVNPNGRGILRTALDDNQGPLTLHAAPTDAATDAGVDGFVVLTTAGPTLDGTTNLVEQAFLDGARSLSGLVGHLPAGRIQNSGPGAAWARPSGTAPSVNGKRAQVHSLQSTDPVLLGSGRRSRGPRSMGTEFGLRDFGILDDYFAQLAHDRAWSW